MLADKRPMVPGPCEDMPSPAAPSQTRTLEGGDKDRPGMEVEDRVSGGVPTRTLPSPGTRVRQVQCGTETTSPNSDNACGKWGPTLPSHWKTEEGRRKREGVGRNEIAGEMRRKSPRVSKDRRLDSTDFGSYGYRA